MAEWVSGLVPPLAAVVFSGAMSRMPPCSTAIGMSLVATWDGSEVSGDNAGDERNMKLFVDSVQNSVSTMGPSYVDVDRLVGSVLLGRSQTEIGEGHFNGLVADIRFYEGELTEAEVDRLFQGLQERYVSGAPGIVLERPYVNQCCAFPQARCCIRVDSR